MGCPGSGKGTQTARLLKHFGSSFGLQATQVFSSGDCLREHINRKTALGKQVEGLLEKGELVPDSVINPMIWDKVERLVKAPEKSFLLDGFPRTVDQAKTLDSQLHEYGKPINFVIDLDVPHSVILQRIEDRWIHAPSGRIYSLSFNPPKVAGKDDVTGEPLTKRPDDNADVFANRLQKYAEATKPLIEYYRNQGVLFQFKGATSDEITPLIIQALSAFLQNKKVAVKSKY